MLKASCWLLQALRIDLPIVVVIVHTVVTSLQLRPQLLHLLHVALHYVGDADAPVAMSAGAWWVAMARTVRDAIHHTTSALLMLCLLLDVVLIGLLDHDLVLGRTMIKHVDIIEEVLIVVTSLATAASDLPLRLVGCHGIRERVRITAQE